MLMDLFTKDMEEAKTLRELKDLQVKYTGKKGLIKQEMKKLAKLPVEEKKNFALQINTVRKQIEHLLYEAIQKAEQKQIEEKLQSEWQDLSLDGIGIQRGSRHPLTKIERKCMAVLRQLGFELVDGPEVDNAFHNFDALNIPEHHPARDMQDTFWVTGGLLLRSHTTTVQARVLSTKPELPIRVASMGRVYRNEAVDATHLAMFHQFEGIWIDRGLTFSHLKGVLEFLARSLYGTQPIRFKPKFYPYTEPSVGVDLQCAICDSGGCSACHGSGWVTILGAGMVHPKVFETFGFDSTEVSGIAFGLGTTRMMSQSVNAPALRPLYNQEMHILQDLNRNRASLHNS